MREQKKRLILFIENLDQLFDRGLSDKMKGTLRRILMTDGFMIVIGSAIHVFESLRNYDKAFFNYFSPIPLTRLSDQEVFDMLYRRAEFDENKGFLEHFSEHKPQIRAIAQLSGGNPRLILMLYELLSENQVTTIVQQLKRLVDELTPLYKHEIENLPAQQQKILHALMEKGGTAKPSELTEATRLSLNAVTMQLRRLKEMQILELRGGGKGRPAFYTVPDTLLSIWYQMRYLRLQRRRIEMFVQVLQIWFEAEERYKTLESLTSIPAATELCRVRERATTAEYFAASLTGTNFEEKARVLALQSWINAKDIREAALVHADFCKIQEKDEVAYEKKALTNLGDWLLNHDEPKAAVSALEKVAKDSNDPFVLMKYGLALNLTEDKKAAFVVFDRVVALQPKDRAILALSLMQRGFIRGELGDAQGEVTDFSAIIESSDMPRDYVAGALYYRGLLRFDALDFKASVADFTTLLEMPVVVANRVDALMYCGMGKQQVGDLEGAIANYSLVIENPDSTMDSVLNALVHRGASKQELGDIQEAINDYTAVIERPNASKERLAEAFVRRAEARFLQDDCNAAISDFDSTLETADLSPQIASRALGSRGFANLRLGREQDGLNDFLRAISHPNTRPKGRLIVATFAYRHPWSKRGQADQVLEAFSASVAAVDNPQRIEGITEFLQDLATSNMKQAWPTACPVLYRTPTD